ncbi:glycosyl transferase family 2 [Rothia nasimurium]|uniref:Glycosyl transferase family 2 n=1 Tax=Rothia nasimurium TaxID=85336 RepID=A0A1Y1RM33_9MICC|nr:glycosyltransferase family 2 protein [Rothia nasimurium]ORC15475.1 glycosyl transferase family 2 [Rothia nasimurium]
MTTSVSVIIATNGKRPELLRTAVTSIFEQTFTGEVEVLVVFDHVEIDPLTDVPVPAHRSLRTLPNTRPQGLAGGRNTGIEAARGEVLGFCDDDDFWLPSKLTDQLELWQVHPEAVAISSGIRVRTGGKDVDRLAPATASFTDFLRSRITEIHPSAMLYRKADLLGRVGLVDEDLPAAYGEDYDLLLRATKFGDVFSVPKPLVLILWDRPSFFAGKWQNMADGLTYLLRKFPEFENDPKGLARISGQIAFIHAALGNRSLALAYARATLRRDITQLRAWAALPVALGLLSPDALLAAVNKTGRGL